MDFPNALDFFVLLSAPTLTIKDMAVDVTFHFL